MITNDESICPNCGGDLKYHDKVKRIVRTKGGNSKWIEIRRMQCSVCGGTHRELPNFILPYKQYESDIINGVLEGLITFETLGYEDYPCEATMTRWVRTHKLQVLL